jgi:hypothetical protein
VPAEHYDLAGGVRAGDLGDGVGDGGVVVVLDGEVQRHGELLTGLNHADEAVVLLHGEDDLRDRGGGVFLPDAAPASGLRCGVGGVSAVVGLILGVVLFMAGLFR